MILNEANIINAQSTFFKNRLMGAKDAVERAFVTQDEVEDEVLRLTKQLNTNIDKFKYNLNPYPHALGTLRKDIPMINKIEDFLPIETYSFDKWDDEEKEVSIAIYPHIDQMKKDLQWIDNERKKIREVAKTAPAGERYAYDKCKGISTIQYMRDPQTVIKCLDNVKKELNKHKEVLR